MPRPDDFYHCRPRDCAKAVASTAAAVPDSVGMEKPPAPCWFAHAPSCLSPSQQPTPGLNSWLTPLAAPIRISEPSPAQLQVSP